MKLLDCVAAATTSLAATIPWLLLWTQKQKKKTIKKGGGLETLTMEFISRGMIEIKKLIILNRNVIIIITIFFKINILRL